MLISNTTKIFSNFSSKIRKSGIFGPKFRHFNFSRNFAIRQILGVDYKQENIFFQILAKNTQRRHFWCQMQIFLFFSRNFFHDFCFCTKLCKNTNSRTQISNMAKVFSNSIPKTRKSNIFGPKFKDFYFAQNVAIRQIRGR